MNGYGASMTDAAAILLMNLKIKNPVRYRDVLTKLFDPVRILLCVDFGFAFQRLLHFYHLCFPVVSMTRA